MAQASLAGCARDGMKQVMLGVSLAALTFWLCGLAMRSGPDVKASNESMVPDAATRRHAEQEANPCADCVTTLDIVECMTKQVEQAQAIQDKYVAAAKRRLEFYAAEATDGPEKRWATEAVQLFEESQQEWVIFRDKQCGAIYTHWAGGTIRSIMERECRLRLIRRRTHDIWTDYLRYLDSLPPLLPEPLIADKSDEALIGN